MAVTSKYLYRDSTSGQASEAQPITTSAGAGDANKIAQTDSAGRFDQSLMPVGVTPDVVVSTASGALSGGDLVYVTSGGLISRASAAVAGNMAIGFVLVASLTGAAATAFFSGRNTAVTGLTVGARYYLSDTTPGAITSTPVTGSGKLHQYVGTAVSATSLAFDRISDAVLLV